jgi:hypothetical protein
MLSAKRLFFFVMFGFALFTIQDHSQADVVILKDGTTLYGNVGKDLTVVSDPTSGETFPITKVNALKFIDDGPRWTVFSDHKNRLADVDNKFNKFAPLEVFHSLLVPGQRQKLPLGISYVKTSEFDKNLSRTVYYRDLTGNGTYQFKQRASVLTPHYVRLDCINFFWTCYYSTQELGPDVIRHLLDTHPDLREKEGEYDVGKRSRKIRFYIQAGWFDEARRDIEALEKVLPTEKEKAETLRKEIRDLQVENAIKSIERYKETGQHNGAKTLLKQLPKELTGKLSLKVASFEADYKKLDKQYEDAKRLLEELLEETLKERFLMDAAKTVLAELHPDSASRLETFVVLGLQAEAARKAEKKVLHSKAELLSTAVTGWLLGKNSAETKIDAAERAWLSREMVLKFQRGETSGVREKLLSEYLQGAPTQKLGVDELAQLISMLPPPEADPKPPVKAQQRATGKIPGVDDGVDYLIQMPPEYSHGRAYPLMILLPNGNEPLESVLSKFGIYPAQHGYITVVLRWNGNFRNEYGYSSDEHATVTGLIWHLRRKYQIDSDRIYLFGAGEGANMALDVGASHPDLFAGVIPMGARPNWGFMKEYWRNFQATPLYMISGDLAGDSVGPIRSCLEKWMPLGYPVLCVLYKGRGSEFFGAEIPYLFDWMPRQVRTTAIPSVGRSFGVGGPDGEDYRTHRNGDNSFYWITADAITPTFIIDRNSPYPKPNYAASVFGKINEGNQIVVRTRGIDALTIWFGKGMIDFSKPVKVQWNQADIRAVNNNKPFTANFRVLLEDLYTRGDRQRPYFEKLELSSKRKK